VFEDTDTTGANEACIITVTVAEEVRDWPASRIVIVTCTEEPAATRFATIWNTAG
jgi:hypothetical protein